MPIVKCDKIHRAVIRLEPERLYVFGDNFAGTGYGGQARECRGEPNSVGIPTKRAPHMREDAFLTDADLEEWRRRAEPAFSRIEEALANGQTVVLPTAGIGTGLAQLEQRAPAIWRELNERLEKFESGARKRRAAVQTIRDEAQRLELDQ